MSKLLETAVIGNVWLRQCILLSIVAIFSLATANAADYYVDAKYGDDDWDGSTAAIPTQEMINAGGRLRAREKLLSAS